jgi:hypothetical protein
MCIKRLLRNLITAISMGINVYTSDEMYSVLIVFVLL